jgi:Flp pilus assembly protein TadD
MALRSWLFATLLVGASACSPSGEQIRGQATLLVERGRTEEAEAVLRAYLAENPSAFDERRMLVRVLGVRGDLGAAEQEAGRLRQARPQSPIPWIELGHAYELAHDYERALSCYDQAAAVAPKDPAGPLEGGLRAARWGEVEIAIVRLEEAARRSPKDPTVWHALGVVQMQLGDPAQARAAYEAGLRADPNALENRIGLATVALSQNRPADALGQYEMILAARPHFADAHLGRAWALIQLGRFDEAREALDEGYRLGANREVVRRQRRLIDHLRSAPLPAENQ